jgi:hypothetical protein
METDWNVLDLKAVRVEKDRENYLKSFHLTTWNNKEISYAYSCIYNFEIICLSYKLYSG